MVTVLLFFGQQPTESGKTVFKKKCQKLTH